MELKKKTKSQFDRFRAQSPDVSRTLYSTGFVYINHNSPKAANVRNKSDLRLKPIECTLNAAKNMVRLEVQDASSTKTNGFAQNRNSWLVPNHRTAIGTIGWGVGNPNLGNVVKRVVVPDQKAKQSFNYGQLKSNIQLQTSGFTSERIDKWLSMPFHDLDQLSVRVQRKIVTLKAEQIFN